MIDYDAFCRIKQLRQQGRTPPQIARELHLHIQTVRLWLARERFRPSAAAARPRPSKLDAFKPALARWLETHPFSAMQLFHKLREQGYAGGYSIEAEQRGHVLTFDTTPIRSRRALLDHERAERK